MEFASDNTSGAAPEILAAINAANAGYASSYGTDPLMDRVRSQIRDIFEAPEAAVYLVATGTAANSLSLSLFCPPWGAVYCHDEAHIEVDECGGEPTRRRPLPERRHRRSRPRPWRPRG